MPTAHLDDGLDDVLRRLIRVGVRLARMILQARWPGCESALDSLGARLTTDAVQCASLSDQQRFPQVIGDEWSLLVHGCYMSPGHEASPWVPTSIIKVLPMSLD